MLTGPSDGLVSSVQSIGFMSQVTYVSEEGLQQLKDELAMRKTVNRLEITSRIASAKELGDLSENFEYHVAKDDQAQNESRILDLEDMIRNASVVVKKSGGKINLGSTFQVKVGGVEKTFQMVGATEADPLAGKISNESPIGVSFVGKEAGDTVEVTVPSGKMSYKILSVE